VSVFIATAFECHSYLQAIRISTAYGSNILSLNKCMAVNVFLFVCIVFPDCKVHHPLCMPSM